MTSSASIFTTLLLGATAVSTGPEPPFGGVLHPGDVEPMSVCSPDGDPPTYYAIPLVTTKNIPATGYTTGTGDVTYAASPFGVSIAPDGSYLYDVTMSFRKLPEPRQGTYVGWATTTEVDQIIRLGTPGADGRIRGQVRWNKFLLVLTLEAEDDPDAETWSGPIVLRGMSRSGKMHTMAGHGPLEDEKCATYGYAN
jgi:hypothetical protein